MRGIRMAMGLVGVLGLSSQAAMAADLSGVYVGGGVGLYNLKIDNSYRPPEEDAVIAEANLGGSGNFEDSGSVWRAFAGYDFNKYIGIQADYVWYGTTQDQIPQNSGVNVKATGDAWELGIKPQFPIGMFDIFARIGMNWYQIDAKRQYVKGESDSNNDPFYAAGIQANFTKSFSMAAEYEYVDASGGDLNATTINFIYKFGAK